jgi:hypothetical protein
MANDKPPSQGRPGDSIGIAVGVLLGCVGIFVLPNVGIIVGAVLPMIGAVLGLIAARLIASALGRGKH